VACSGIESSLGECNHNEWGNHDCNPSFECVKIYCAGGGPEPELIEVEPDGRITQNPVTGVLSVIYDNVPKAMCDDGFMDNSA
jgi:hypothetical protein